MKCEHCGEEFWEDSLMPVTEEWLRSVGFKEWDDGLGLCFHGGGSVLDIEEDFSMAIFNYAATSDEQSASLPGYYKTRGDVRRLCAALGIPLKAS